MVTSAPQATHGTKPPLNGAMDRYASGESQAFVALHQALYPRLLAYLARMSGSSTSAAGPGAQETFPSACTGRGPPSPRAAAVPALGLRHRAQRGPRPRPRRKLRETERLPSDPGLEIVDRSGADAESAAIAAQAARRVVEVVLAGLPPAQRDAFILLRYEGLSVHDAASVLGATQTAVKLRAFRAYEALRAALRRSSAPSSAPRPASAKSTSERSAR